MPKMMTITGKMVDPCHLQVEDIDILDIAHGLAYTCRYGGHVSRFYSVAEHCVLMSRWVPREYAFQALLHDASEAYLGDIVNPLKQSLPDYKEIEANVEWQIAAKFGQGQVLAPIVKEADSRIVADERNALVPRVADFPSSRVPLGVQVTGWDPWLAKMVYLDRFRELAR